MTRTSRVQDVNGSDSVARTTFQAIWRASRLRAWVIGDKNGNRGTDSAGEKA
jgi:hypothetical protein